MEVFRKTLAVYGKSRLSGTASPVVGGVLLPDRQRPGGGFPLTEGWRTDAADPGGLGDGNRRYPKARVPQPREGHDGTGHEGRDHRHA